MNKKKCTDTGPKKKSKGNSSKPLKVLSWNVQGFSNPLGPITRSVSARINNPPSYVAYLCEFDVVILQETWLKENPFVGLMLDYEWVHIPSRDPEGTRGRKKGGFTIGWRRSIPSRNVTTQLVGSGEWGSVELSLNGTWIQVVGLYRHNTTEFEELNIQFNHALPILLMGDMNSRTKNRQTSPEFPRESKDTGRPHKVVAFTKMLKVNGLHILNGSVEGDMPGENTRIGTRRGQTVESCIDYAAVNGPMLKLVRELRVDKSRRESDHRPLQVTLAVEDEDEDEEEKEKEQREREIEKIKQKEKELKLEKARREKEEMETIEKEKKAREVKEKREREERERKEREKRSREEREKREREEKERKEREERRKEQELVKTMLTVQRVLTPGAAVVGIGGTVAVAVLNPGILTGKAVAKTAAASSTCSIQ